MQTGSPIRCAWSMLIVAVLAAGACAGHGGDDDSFGTVADDDDEDTGDDDSGGSREIPWNSTAPIARIDVNPTHGTLPLTVSLSAARSLAPAGVADVTWVYGGGHTATGTEVEVVLLSAGVVGVTATVTDDFGRSDTASARIEVEQGPCPQAGEAVSSGVLDLAEINETSGVVESRSNPGVLWVHNDSGDSPRLFAVASDGRHLGTYDLDGAPSGDWEDLAITRAADGVGWVLVAGDVGDNAGVRESIRVFLVDEPAVDVAQEPVTETVAFETLELTYPDGQSLNCETIAVDPVSGDLLVVTKNYGGPTGVYRKSAPLQAGGPFELELVVELDFGAPPLSGNATTGGDISPLGDRLVIRTYGTTAFVWRWDRSVDLAYVLAADPCEIVMPQEHQSESIAFGADGSGLWSISEGEGAAVNFVPIVP